MEKLSFKTEQFEGPLDLLLHLISKHKLNICDIQISELLEQYVRSIQAMEDADLEVASEFLEMASRLVYIKTVMLLPRHEEEGKQLRAELQGQLLEYQVCKLVAAKMGERNRMFSRFVRSPLELDIDTTYLLTHPAEEIYSAYQDAIGRGRRRLPPPPQAFSGIVARRMVSVGSRIIFVLKSLYRSGRATYESLFIASGDRSEMVATFLAVLELVKARRITVDDGEVVFDRSKRSQGDASNDKHTQDPGAEETITDESAAEGPAYENKEIRPRPF